jgi:hypothetical protein
MNMKNLEFLNDQIFYTGFGKELEEELKAKLEKGEKSFDLNYQNTYGTDKVEAKLNFTKSSQSELYFFNSYDLHLQKGNGKEVNQRFFIGKENNITMKEAYNLLCGRAINKSWTKLEKVGEGDDIKYKPTDEKYDAWLQLDFDNKDANGNFKALRYHDNYNFDLDKVLSEQNIRGISNEADKQQLVDSLKKGNRQAMIKIDGEEIKQIFIEANPKDRIVNVYEAKQDVNQKEEITKSLKSQKLEVTDSIKRNQRKQKKPGMQV